MATPSIPKEVLRNIFEFSNGGYVLFTFDEEGQATIHSMFDSEKDEIALNDHIAKYSIVMNERRIEDYREIFNPTIEYTDDSSADGEEAEGA